jgi:hypothetical protein
MIFQRCSDVVESPVEHAILDTESRRNAALVQFRNSSGALIFGERRALLMTIRRISAAANACHDFVRMEAIANPDFHADLCGPVHRSNTPALMLNKSRV